MVRKSLFGGMTSVQGMRRRIRGRGLFNDLALKLYNNADKILPIAQKIGPYIRKATDFVRRLKGGRKLKTGRRRVRRGRVRRGRVARGRGVGGDIGDWVGNRAQSWLGFGRHNLRAPRRRVGRGLISDAKAKLYNLARKGRDYAIGQVKSKLSDIWNKRKAELGLGRRKRRVGRRRVARGRGVGGDIGRFLGDRAQSWLGFGRRKRRVGGRMIPVLSGGIRRRVSRNLKSVF
jgi:hypothetical protein